ncbi:MAG TPA: prephenate dehydratase domain-containing protein [Acidobacteriaceae bacterium]|jgi:prephenate dehydratase
MEVAIQGEYGSFSHQAALHMVPEATILPCAYSAEVFAKVVKDNIAAVIPIENSLAGSVVEHFDLLSQNDVRIDGELLLRIRHNLIGVPGSKLECIRRVSSHPVALAQCRRFLAHHPEMTPSPAYDTAGSVKQIVQGGDPTAGAIASLHASVYYGGYVLAADIEDNPANFTRFFLIHSNREAKLQTSFNKVSIAFIVENRPGTLVSALQVFADNHTNLNKIESRPVHGQPWEYVFYVDYQVSQPGAASSVLNQLRGQCLVVKELGRYQAARDPF